MAGLQDLTHDDVLDLLGLDTRALEGGLDRDAPSSVASSVDRPPPILPMGVRAAPRITVLGIEAILLI